METKTEDLEKSYRMCEGVINLPVQSRLRRDRIERYDSLVTTFGVSIQGVLDRIKKDLVIEFDADKRISRARLKVTVNGDRIERAKKLLAQDMTPFGYTNGYQLVSLVEGENATAEVEFEIAKATLPAPEETRKRRRFRTLSANFLKQVILCWCKYSELDALKLTNRQGAPQKVAEQMVSYLELLDVDPNTAFPSTGERSPQVKRTAWLGALSRVAANMSGFEYKPLREVDPTIPADDPKGNRRVNVDPDWILFSEGPEVNRFPVSFGNNDIVVYRRHRSSEAKEKNKIHYPSHEGRLWALIPVDGVTEKDRWWVRHAAEFTPLPAFKNPPKLSPKTSALLVPLEYRDNLDILWEKDRTVKWTILTEEKEYRRRHGHKGNNLPFLGKRWVLKFATETSVRIIETTRSLGVYFHNDDTKLVVIWALAQDGVVTQTGEFDQTQVLNYALLRKSYLENMQRARRWVGGKKFRRELKRRTEALAHRIVSLAESKNAEIVIEDIRYVQKTGQGPDLNSRHSLWNYADLLSMIEFFAKDRVMLPTRRVNEFVLKFTCPSCKAIRKEGQKKDELTTWREGDILNCRKCGTCTRQDRLYFAKRIALTVSK